MQRRSLLTTLGAAALAAPVSAQTFGSHFDPQLASLSIEGRIPLSNVISDIPNALNFSEQALAGLAAGAIELRGRVDFNRAARLFRIYFMLVPTSFPYPLPVAPEIEQPGVGAAFDMSIEHARWYEWGPISPSNQGRRVVTFLGRRLGSYKGAVPLPNEPIVVQVGFDRLNPSAIRMISVSSAGAITAIAINPAGSIELDRSN